MIDALIMGEPVVRRPRRVFDNIENFRGSYTPPDHLVDDLEPDISPDVSYILESCNIIDFGVVDDLGYIILEPRNNGAYLEAYRLMDNQLVTAVDIRGGGSISISCNMMVTYVNALTRRIRMEGQVTNG